MMRYTPVSCPGPGDSETWAPWYGHPNDPRTEDDFDDEQENDEPSEEE